MLTQTIEGFNIADLGWGTANARSVTISFWVKASITGTYTVAFRNSALNRSYRATYTINAANTWEYKTVTVAGDTTGTWLTDNGAGIRVGFTLGAGSDFIDTGNVWSALEDFAATGQTQWISTNGATFYITGSNWKQALSPRRLSAGRMGLNWRCVRGTLQRRSRKLQRLLKIPTKAAHLIAR